MKHCFYIIILLFLTPKLLYCQSNEWLLPIDAGNRKDVNSIHLTKIGAFGALRKARPGIPAHLHTGIDITRPNDNYTDNPIFPAAFGKVISLRDDGPFAQIIIEHHINDDKTVWTVYEHIAGITVSVGDKVNPYDPIARFMNTTELDMYGWQFDHVHFEVLKHKPIPLTSNQKTPFKFFNTYSLQCYTAADLNIYYYNPKSFLN